MSLRARPFSAIVRAAAFIILAVMLVVSLGPLCETMAMAATPVASTTMTCADAPINSPAKKLSPSACATPCTAVLGETVAHIEPIPFAALSPWAVAHTGLLGLASAPATPPPQIV